MRSDSSHASELTVYQSAAQLNAANWPAESFGADWLSIAWLRAFELAGGPPCQYVVASKDGEPVGVALVQQLPVERMKIGAGMRAQLAAVVFGKSLYQMGQVLFSGPGGHHFLAGAPLEQFIGRIRKAVDPHNAGGWLVKDCATALDLANWHHLDVLPEMVLDIAPERTSADAFLGAMKSKYRRRLTRARRKLEPIEKRVLGIDELVALEKHVDALYGDLIDRSSYVPYRVPPGYFSRLAAEAPDGGFTMSGYFLEDRLVGFSTLLQAGSECIAHYAAVDVAYNVSHQLYLNLLLDLASNAIDRGAQRLHLGRTATTIKSSIGARPVAYHSYAVHDGCIRNQLLGLVNARAVTSDDADAQIQHPFGTQA